MKDYFRKLDEIVRIIGDRYFIDPTVEKVKGKEVQYWKILMNAFSYLGKKNTLLEGNPGSGKTTCSGVVSSILSGLPFDLYDFLKITGHPDQTKDTMLSRVDLGRLAEEGVVWQPSLYLPALTLDEINRLPPGKQSIFLEYIRTGAVEHLGKYFSRGKIPIFATMNYNGTGTYELPPPSLDRFDISLEFGAGPAWLQDIIRKAGRQIRKDLDNPAMTEEIVHLLMNKDKSKDEKIKFLQDKAKENNKRLNDVLKKHDRNINIPILEPIDTEAVDMPYSADASTFLRCIWDEINTSVLYGENRSVDPRDKSSHNKDYGSAKVKGGISARSWDGIKFYASMLARYFEADKVEIEHVQAVAPYCLAHRLQFDEDYSAKSVEAVRKHGERQEQDLSRRLLKDIKDNYDKVEHDLKQIDKFLQEGEKASEALKNAVKGIIAKPQADHPTLRHYCEFVNDNHKKELGI